MDDRKLLRASTEEPGAPAASVVANTSSTCAPGRRRVDNAKSATPLSFSASVSALLPDIAALSR